MANLCNNHTPRFWCSRLYHLLSRSFPEILATTTKMIAGFGFVNIIHGRVALVNQHVPSGILDFAPHFITVKEFVITLEQGAVVKHKAHIGPFRSSEILPNLVWICAGFVGSVRDYVWWTISQVNSPHVGFITVFVW